MENDRLTNTDIMQCEMYLKNVIENELNKGIPIAVMSFILDRLLNNVGQKLETVLQEENELMNQMNEQEELQAEGTE